MKRISFVLLFLCLAALFSACTPATPSVPSSNVTVTGTVTSVEETVTARRRGQTRTYLLSISYQMDNQSYDTSASLSALDYFQVKESPSPDKVLMSVDPEEPTMARFLGPVPQTMCETTCGQ